MNIFFRLSDFLISKTMENSTNENSLSNNCTTLKWNDKTEKIIEECSLFAKGEKELAALIKEKANGFFKGFIF